MVYIQVIFPDQNYHEAISRQGKQKQIKKKTLWNNTQYEHNEYPCSYPQSILTTWAQKQNQVKFTQRKCNLSK